MKRSIQIILVVTASLVLVACNHFKPEQVKPWQRKTLARSDMQLTPSPSQEFLDEHIYFSKEAATGGKSVGGGGCGCN